MLKRFSFFMVLLVLLLIGCGQGGEVPAGVSEQVTEGTAVSAAVPSESPDTQSTPSPAPTHTPPPTDPPTPLPTPTASPVPLDLSLTAENVRLYPVPMIYSGEQVTFQVWAHVPDNIAPEDVSVHILVDYQDIANGTLSHKNLAGDAISLFEWVWDTTGQTGEHLVHVILDRHDVLQAGDENRDNNQVAIPVVIHDVAAKPATERNATWVTAETGCCVVRVVSGTAAYRDLTELLAQIETAVAQSAAKLNVTIEDKLDIYLIDRVIGQGGYAGNDIVVSYLDRQYASQGFYQVMVHEATHILDRQFAPERITFLAEGLAVWTAEGHYKQENLKERTAALVAIDQYIPLANLIDNFYPVQHEIGYLESAGLVNYLIETYGWPTFRDFYADVTPADAATLSAAVDVNMQKYFSRTLAQVEQDWLASLNRVPVSETAVADLQTSIRYYNVMRRYQQQYDPTAYFLTAWLPYPQDMLNSGNTADLTRHPESQMSIALEALFLSADKALRAGDYQRANILLDSITRTMDNNGIFVDPIGINYYNLVQGATAEGYEVQEITLNGDRAVVKATKPNSQIIHDLSWQLAGQNWILSN